MDSRGSDESSGGVSEALSSAIGGRSVWADNLSAGRMKQETRTVINKSLIGRGKV